jgi:FkbM family methyltransferase
LERNIHRNNSGKIETYHCAVHSQEGFIDFELSNDNAGDNRIKPSQTYRGTFEIYGESQRRSVRVPCSRLDVLVDATLLVAPVVMKCDIQGGEVGLFKGADRTLAMTNFLLSEYWPYGMERLGYTADEYLAHVRDHFSFGQILDGEAWGHAGLLPVAEVLERANHLCMSKGRGGFCDILLAKTHAMSEGVGRSPRLPRSRFVD